MNEAWDSACDLGSGVHGPEAPLSGHGGNTTQRAAGWWPAQLLSPRSRGLKGIQRESLQSLVGVGSSLGVVGWRGEVGECPGSPKRSECLPTGQRERQQVCHQFSPPPEAPRTSPGAWSHMCSEEQDCKEARQNPPGTVANLSDSGVRPSRNAGSHCGSSRMGAGQDGMQGTGWVGESEARQKKRPL